VSRPLGGLRLAVTTLTVLPLRSPTGVDRTVAGYAMSLAPAVGAGLGAVLAGSGYLLLQYGLAPFPIAVLMVGLLALLSRGLHLDGLADTVDGLASYRPAEGALSVMATGDVGPLGAGAVAVVLLGQTAALQVLIARHDWLAIVVALVVGRSAITWCCRRGIPAARKSGLGALVAGSVPVAVPIGWLVAGLLLSWPATHRHWTGLVAVTIATAIILALLPHLRRRLGGITGDVLGAACELSTTIALLLLSVR
jgi:adenosylcobinamide-GDP ribazoletransferase